jgi:shikimate kinase
MLRRVARRGTVWLVGMMGAGKSSVGPALARRLGADFLDVDREVEKRAGTSVASLFAEAGEAAFRRLEREAWEGVAGRPIVAALGGGAIAQPGAAERLAATGTIVWLRARAETLLARIDDPAGRPLLADVPAAARAERLRRLLAEREPCYARADVVVDTDGLGVAEVVDAVARRLEQAP